MFSHHKIWQIKIFVVAVEFVFSLLLLDYLHITCQVLYKHFSLFSAEGQWRKCRVRSCRRTPGLFTLLSFFILHPSRPFIFLILCEPFAPSSPSTAPPCPPCLTPPLHSPLSSFASLSLSQHSSFSSSPFHGRGLSSYWRPSGCSWHRAWGSILGP